VKDVRYFAVPDPDDATRMTYWRETARNTSAWPNAAKYGPVLWKRDMPAGLSPSARQDYVARWYLEVRNPWLTKIRESLDTTRDEATARFAALQLRCGFCGKALTDPKSKTIGIGPDCRDGFPDSLIATFVEAVGRAHAEHLGK